MTFPSSPPAGGFPTPGGFPGAAPAGPSPDSKPKGKKGGKAKEAKPVNKRVLGVNRNLALGFGLAAGLIVLGAYNGTAPEDLYVVRAAEAINAADGVTVDALQAVKIPNNALLEPGAFSGATQDRAIASAMTSIGEGRARFPIPARAQLRQDMFAATTADVGSSLGVNERLVSINATVGAAVAGELRAGDRVDVVVASNGGATPLVSLLLSDVELVKVGPSEQSISSAADQQSGQGKDKAPSEILPSQPIPGTYVLRVPTEKILPLVSANAHARLYLVLRGADATPIPTQAVAVEDVLCGTYDPANLPPVRARGC